MVIETDGTTVQANSIKRQAMRAEFFTLNRGAKERVWWENYTDALPVGYPQSIGLEAEAESIGRFSNHPVARSLADRGLRVYAQLREL